MGNGRLITLFINRIGIAHSVRPFVVMSLIGLCSLVFLYELFISGFAVIGGGDSEALTVFFLKWGFVPVELTRGEAFTA